MQEDLGEISDLLRRSEFLARGGQGTVFRLPNRGEVIKLSVLRGPYDVKQAGAELRMSKEIQHPHAVFAHDTFSVWVSPEDLLGIDAGRYFDEPSVAVLMLVQRMAYVGGSTLIDWAKEVSVDGCFLDKIKSFTINVSRHANFGLSSVPCPCRMMRILRVDSYLLKSARP